MAEAKRDGNMVTTLLAVSNADGVTPVVLYADPTTHRLLVSATAGSLNDLSDVVITGGAQGDILYFNGTDWVNLGAGNSGEFLKTQGAAANPVWAAATAGAAGSDTQVQFNDGGVNLGGDAGFVYNKTTDTVSANGGFLPITNDTGALGSATLSFADLFLASGALINFANSDAVITHSAGILTVSTGDLRVTTAGTNAASAVTVGGTQTLTNKTLTSPTIGTSPTAAGATWTDLGTVTTADINGGTIDGATIGGASAGAITGTTITANTGFLPDADGGAYLGQATQAFSGLFLDTLATINFDNSNVVITHSSGVLTMGTGDFRVTTAGTDAASVVTVGGTQTLTNKTLTSPAINTGTIGTSLVPTANDGAALGSTTNQFSDLFLAEGGVINWDNGDATITQAGNVITFAGITSLDVGTSTAVTLGTIELGAASDTTLARSAAGQVTIEGVQVVTATNTMTVSNKIIAQTFEPATDDTYTGEHLTGLNAGATIAQWDCVYLGSASKWLLTDADAASSAGGVLVAMAAAAGTDTNALTVILRGIVRNDGWTWATVGAPLYLDTTTAGGMTLTAPSATDDVVRIVGYVLSDDCIYFNPSNDWITRV